MKIALIRREYAAGRGGAERYAVTLSRALAQRGHDVHVFAGIVEPGQHAGITLHPVPFLRKPSALKNASFQKNSRRLVAAETFDIVHGLSQVFPQDVYRVGEPLHMHWLLQRTGSRLHRLVKYCSPRHQVILTIERHIFMPDNYRRIIVNSRLCRQQVIDYYGVPEKKIRLVYNGVDPAAFSFDTTGRTRTVAREKLGIAPAEFILLFAGNDFKRKGLIHALQTTRRLRESGYRVRLAVAGRGSARSAQRSAAACGAADAVLFLGSVGSMRDLYHAADLLLLPSLYDPFSNVCLEAMACGLPVVTARSNGACEIIDSGISGIVVDTPQDTEQMAAQIARLCDPPGQALAAMGQAAAETAKNYSLEQNVEKTLRVYEEIIREKQGIA